MAFTRFSSLDRADIALLLNRLGDELTAEQAGLGQTALWDQVANKPATYPPAPHTHGWAAIDGKPATYPPAAHTHADLDNRLDLLEYMSGSRNITASMAVQPVSGSLYLERIGAIVWADLSGLRMPATAGFVSLPGLFPTGFRPRRIQDFATAKRNNTDPAGALRVDLSGDAYLYVVDSTREIRGVVSWPTRDAPPAPGTEPGTPA